MQKYQVFIKEHSICFAEKAEKYEQLNSIMFINNYSKEIFKCVIEWLLKENDTIVQLTFICKDVLLAKQEFESLFTLIAAAGGKVRNLKKELLWIKRLGKWDFPKGKIEEGETIETAAVREVEEECGIVDLQILKPLPSTYHIYKLKNSLILKQTFWFEMKTSDNSELVPQLEEDIEQAVWMSEENSFKALQNTYPSIRRLF